MIGLIDFNDEIPLRPRIKSNALTVSILAEATSSSKLDCVYDFGVVAPSPPTPPFLYPFTAGYYFGDCLAVWAW